MAKTAWAKARVLDASDRSYLEKVLPILDRARKEISISLYLIEPNDQAGPDHPVNRLIETLLRARSRSVRVRIYLNTNFRFRPKTEVGIGAYFEKLVHQGAEITALLPRQRLHDKLIVIDRRFVVEGSTNWSVTALESNFESASVIDSPAHARQKLERIARLTEPSPKKKTEKDTPLLSLPEVIEIPVALFQEDYLPRMISSSDGRIFDLYLTLLGQADATGRNDVTIDLETLGKALALPKDWTRSQIRRQMIKVLRKLSDEYRLIETEFPYAEDARIRMKEFHGEKIKLPARFFDPATISAQPSGTTFLELARERLKKEGIDIDSLSAHELEERFGVGRSTIMRTRSKL